VEGLSFPRSDHVNWKYGIAETRVVKIYVFVPMMKHGEAGEHLTSLCNSSLQVTAARCVVLEEKVKGSGGCPRGRLMFCAAGVLRGKAVAGRVLVESLDDL
jgi:hypothetical protein